MQGAKKMKGLRLGKSLDRQLREQGFRQIIENGDYETILSCIGGESTEHRREYEWYFAPCYIVGLRGEGYTLYYRSEGMR